MEVLARHAIEDVVEAVAVREEQELARSAAEVGVDEDGDFRGVDIVDVVRRELKMPAQRAGVDVHGNQRIGVQVVALANVADEIGPGIASSPVRQICLRVECAR